MQKADQYSTACVLCLTMLLPVMLVNATDYLHRRSAISSMLGLFRRCPWRWGVFALCAVGFATPALAQQSVSNGEVPAPKAVQKKAPTGDCGGYSLARKPFINPGIIKDLEPWISDSGEQVVSINVPGSMGTNRYYHAIEVSSVAGKTFPYVQYQDKSACKRHSCPFGPPFFGYRLLGRTASGLFVLFTQSGGGGSGRFENLLIVTLEHGRGLAYKPPGKTLKMNRNRCLITRLAQIPLGDRYSGSLRVRGNTLFIGKDHNPHSAGLIKHATTLHIDPAGARAGQ